MATTQDYIDFITDQIEGSGEIRSRKMFGEYMVYVNDRPLLLVCDNTVYIKMHDAITSVMKGCPTGHPYNGAKEHYILDLEDREKALAVISALLPVIPIPVKKTKTGKEKKA
ncbi:MAG: TfoX/Sxy family protein [Spirochaetales bacterium]|jgi:TfoX/Sxy family transcriptional regulator of competence genes|nr:TfoX/Sxy family protein [Spirochaetales bacterium]